MDVAKTQQRIEQVWKWLEDGKITQAARRSQQLVDRLWGTKRTLPNCFLRVQAYYLAGYTLDLQGNVRAANGYFDRMLTVARYMEDDGLIAIALAYKGELQRRSGYLKKARLQFQQAYEKTQEQTTLGHCAQLFARLASQLGEDEQFERLMNEACRLANNAASTYQVVQRQYCLGAVYLEYCDHYGRKGEVSKASEYFLLAEKVLPATPHWKLALTASHGLLLVRSNCLEQGIDYVVNAVKLAKKHGNARILAPFYTLRNDLSHQAIALSKANIRLGDAFYGSSE